ncbi:cation:proton antiporter [Chromobacterium sp. IIBBL 290-4]|uniref:cation:proton antiporter n=1 Tax=Chromobacterium sp. IIBBL 290-4 TaxID=2953890 RepID=UPI0020B8B2FF|nr:cation:proton antiporter [Chromobacterium sp. IIBBL 290-4]UTH73643.1 cation:proton antiporter [Chromobacterium sp. IIBBL 290-4]
MSLPIWRELMLNPLAAFGILLALGVMGGQIAARIARLPAIAGYILTGLLIGPYSLNLLNAQLLHEAAMFVQLALGIALFEAGRRVDLRWLRVEKALLLTSLLYCALLFVALFALLNGSGFGISASLMLASLGMATSPIVVLEIVRESRADGQVSERLLTATALSSLLAITGFALSLSYAHLSANHSVEEGILMPSWLILGSAALGIVAGIAATQLNHWLGGRQREAQRVLLFGLIALLVGLADMLQLLAMLALLIAGISTRGLRHGYTVSEPGILSLSHVFTVAFFVSAGAQLSPPALAAHWQLALLCLLLRVGIGIAAWWLAARLNGLSRRQGALLGLALSPMNSGSSLLLGLGMVSLGEAAASFSAALMAALLVNEIIAPVLTRLALRQAGETASPSAP